MDTVTLGKTGITVNKNGFGALPIQRVSREEAARLLTAALDGGMTFFDTARFYTDSEEKIGYALSARRNEFYLATKTAAVTAEGFWADLETSLRNLKTDHVDLYQFHNPAFCPKPGDGTGLYEAMLEAKAQGKVRFIGITNHRIAVAQEAIASGLYDTLQFPFCYLATDKDQAIRTAARDAGMGFIAMKALSGGLLTSAEAAYAFFQQFDNAVPIWGMQKKEELAQFLDCAQREVTLTPELEAVIAKDREELAGNFCRGCGYCMPCPQGIQLNTICRLPQLLRRSPWQQYMNEYWTAELAKVETCLHCGLCESRCPYGLKCSHLIAENLEDWRQFRKEKGIAD